MGLPTLLRKGFIVDKNDSPILEDVVPLDHVMEWFKLKSDFSKMSDRVLILKSSTGSGKSTILPPAFFHRVISNKVVACTQPRILNALSIPKQIVAYYTDSIIPLVLGKNIGFSTSSQSVRITGPGILYMTIGILYVQLSNTSDEEFIKKYSCIFIDEAHERSILLDMTVYLLKRLLERNMFNKECPYVVIMSATLDTNLFSKYFNSDDAILIKGESYPITEYFIPQISNKGVFSDAVDIVLKFHKENLSDASKFRDVLIFVSGLSDITQLKKMIGDLNTTECKTDPILPIEVTSDSVKRNPTEIFEDISKIKMKIGDAMVQPTRRVFIGTNVAETGVTIETLKCVIDLGFFKSSEMNPVLESSLLITKPVTQSMHIQRRGRVGRQAPGICYNVFTTIDYDRLLHQQFSDIIKDELTSELLNLIVQNNKSIDKKTTVKNNLQTFETEAFDIFGVDFLEQPSIQHIQYSLNKMFYLGAIDAKGQLTKLGYLMSRIKEIPIEQSAMLLWGYVYDVAIIDLVHIILMLSVRVVKIAHDGETDIYNDDFIAGIFEFNSYFGNVRDGATEELFVLREKILLSLSLCGMDPYKNYSKQLVTQPTNYEYVKRLKQCIYEGFKMNVMRWNGEKYETRLGVLVDSEFKSKFCIYKTLLFKTKKDVLKFTVDKVCKLDGFVGVNFFFDVVM
jgi:HrpA-like RNA helicase